MCVCVYMHVCNKRGLAGASFACEKKVCLRKMLNADGLWMNR